MKNYNYIVTDFLDEHIAKTIQKYKVSLHVLKESQGELFKKRQQGALNYNYGKEYGLNILLSELNLIQKYLKGR